MNEFDFSKLPDKLQSGLNEYYRLWNNGLKKKANAILSDTMEYYDTLSLEIHRIFAECICSKICNNQTDMIPNYLPYQISVRLSKELLPYVEEGILPQALWYCIIFGNLDDKISVYQKNKENIQIAELLISALISILSYGSHHFPEYSCIEYKDFEMAYNLGNEILEKLDINEYLQKEYDYYIKLHKLFYTWNKNDDFSSFCEKNGLKFNEIKAYYYQ